MSNFGFLERDFPAVHGAAAQAERYVKSDPRSASFYARRALELALNWLYDNDGVFRRPYDDSLASLMAERSFGANVPPGVRLKADAVRRLGNAAVHSNRAVREHDALSCVQELFHIGYWLARTYGRTLPGDLPQLFDPGLIPSPDRETQASAKALQKLEDELKKRDEAARVQAQQLEDYRAQLLSFVGNYA